MLKLPALSLTGAWAAAAASYWGVGGQGTWTQKCLDVLAEGGSEPSKEQAALAGARGLGPWGRHTRETEEGHRPATLRARCGRVCVRGVRGGARLGGGRECDTPRPGQVGSCQRLGWDQLDHFQLTLHRAWGQAQGTWLKTTHAPDPPEAKDPPVVVTHEQAVTAVPSCQPPSLGVCQQRQPSGDTLPRTRAAAPPGTRGDAVVTWRERPLCPRDVVARHCASARLQQEVARAERARLSQRTKAECARRQPAGPSAGRPPAPRATAPRGHWSAVPGTHPHVTPRVCLCACESVRVHTCVCTCVLLHK